MTKREFKIRWEKDENGDGITFDEIAECAKKWGLFSVPRIYQIDTVRYAVLKAARTSDCEDYNPTKGKKMKYEKT